MDMTEQETTAAMERVEGLRRQRMARLLNNAFTDWMPESRLKENTPAVATHPLVVLDEELRRGED